MSIVAIQNRVTKDLDEFERLKLSDDSKIFCSEPSLENFSITLTIGDQWASNVSRADPSMYMIDGDTITLRPLSSVVIEVNENISLPYNIFGLITQKGSAFLERGLIIGSGKVDPSFSGHLQVLIFNSTRKPVTLKRKEVIANLMFFRTDTTIQSPIFEKKQTARIKTKSPLSKIAEFFASDMKYTLSLFVTILTSSVVAVVLTLILTSERTEAETPIKQELPAQTVDEGIE